MVTKLADMIKGGTLSSVLAKIHMVTKHVITALNAQDCSVLAKIHMVTKLLI